jgi:hypothetical protein
MLILFPLSSSYLWSFCLIGAGYVIFEARGGGFGALFLSVGSLVGACLNGKGLCEYKYRGGTKQKLSFDDGPRCDSKKELFLTAFHLAVAIAESSSTLSFIRAPGLWSSVLFISSLSSSSWSQTQRHCMFVPIPNYDATRVSRIITWDVYIRGSP